MIPKPGGDETAAKLLRYRRAQYEEFVVRQPQPWDNWAPEHWVMAADLADAALRFAGAQLKFFPIAGVVSHQGPVAIAMFVFPALPRPE